MFCVACCAGLGVLAAGRLNAANCDAVRTVAVAAAVAQPEPETQPGGMTAPERQLLNQLIYRNRRCDVLLQRVQRELAEKNGVDGLACLQRILDEKQDSFVWLDGSPEPTSVRREAQRILSAQGPRMLATYNQIYEPEAQRLVSEAQRTGSVALYEEAGRRFFHTESGFSAIDRQAIHLLDQGRYEWAARNWMRLIEEPAHRARVTPELLFKAALAQRLSGRRGVEPSLAARLGGRRFQMAGKPIAGEDLFSFEIPNSPRVTALSADDWPLPGGDARRNRSIEASTAYLRPLWSLPLVDRTNEAIGAAFAGWEADQRKNSQPLAVANTAIVVGNTLVVRDFGHIRAVDLRAGGTLWKYSCATSLSQAARELPRNDMRQGGRTNSGINIQQAYAANSTLGSLASDGQRIYAIDAMQLVPRPRHRSDAEGDDDAEVSRESNRLVALSLNPRDPAKDNPQEPLWSKGGPLDTAAPFDAMDGNHDGRIERDEFTGEPGRFEDIDSDADGAIRPAELEASSGFSNHALCGHFFLGPPLPVEGLLFVVTEFDRQLNLSALRPETGDVVWSQGLGFVERPIDADSSRYPVACSPAYADGIIVCPTQLGILVAVDASAGSLLWVYYYGDESMVSSDGRWTGRYVSYGHPGFPSTPVIHGDRIVYLPQNSGQIHCLALSTGKSMWRVSRNQAEYIATANDDMVLIVGRRGCQGLNAATGAEQWSLPLGMPAGIGAPAGSNYLVPLEEGRIAAVDVRKGREVGFPMTISEAPLQFAQLETSQTYSTNDGEPPSASDVRVASDTAEPVQTSVPGDVGGSWRPGNLIACRGLVLSVGTQEVTAFRQARAMLDEVHSTRLAGSVPPADRILAAELELALGHLEPAKVELATALSSPLESRDRLRARELMRELLYHELKTAGINEPAILAELEELAESPYERGRYLIQKAEFLLNAGDFEEAVRSTRDFAELNLEDPLPLGGNTAHLVSSECWIAGMIGRVRVRFNEDELSPISAEIDAEQRAALEAGDIATLQRFLSRYADWPQAVDVRARLARVCAAAGGVQRAELLLLENRRSDDPQVAAAATAQLADLWDRAGIYGEAAAMLGELNDRFRDVPVADGCTGGQLVRRFLERPTGDAYRRRALPDFPVARVRITNERLWGNDPIRSETYQHQPRLFQRNAGGAFQILQQTSGDLGRLVIIDQGTGVAVGHVDIPSKHTGRSALGGVGHFFALGSDAAVHGISLLERHDHLPFWSTAPTHAGGQSSSFRAGPAGPSFCTFQCQGHLLVVDPASGKVLWQRWDLDPESGLNGDPYSGLFGDEDVLVVLAPDRTAYTVYRTLTGETLRQGKLDVDLRQQRHAIGRKLFYLSESSRGRRMCLWDPLEDELLLDEPASGRVLSSLSGDELLVALVPTRPVDDSQRIVGRVQIIDTATGAPRLNVAMPAAEFANLSSVEFFSDEARDYLSLQRGNAAQVTSTYSYQSADPYVPSEEIRGDLYAIDRASGQRAWKRTFARRSVLRTPSCRLPFLITVSKVRDNRQSGSSAPTLLVEVIDAATGRTLGLRDDVAADRIVHLSYDPAKARVELGGIETTIGLEFGPEVQRIARLEAGDRVL